MSSRPVHVKRIYSLSFALKLSGLVTTWLPSRLTSPQYDQRYVSGLACLLTSYPSGSMACHIRCTLSLTGDGRRLYGSNGRARVTLIIAHFLPVPQLHHRAPHPTCPRVGEAGRHAQDVIQDICRQQYVDPSFACASPSRSSEAPWPGHISRRPQG